MKKGLICIVVCVPTVIFHTEFEIWFYRVDLHLHFLKMGRRIGLHVRPFFLTSNFEK